MMRVRSESTTERVEADRDLVMDTPAKLKKEIEIRFSNSARMITG